MSWMVIPGLVMKNINVSRISYIIRPIVCPSLLIDLYNHITGYDASYACGVWRTWQNASFLFGKDAAM